MAMSTTNSDIHCTSDSTGNVLPVENKRKSRLRSTVWDEFERRKDGTGHIAKCIHCNVEFVANGTGSLKAHLKRCKPRNQEGGQHSATSKNDEGTPSFKSSRFNQERSRRDVSEMIVKHEYPFLMVEHAYFRKFVKNLQPLFDLKRRSTVKSDIMALFKEKRGEFYRVLGKLPSRISLTTDLWTAKNTRDCYLCLTCHFIDDDWVLNDKILNFRLMDSSHSGDELARVVHRCLLEWNIDKKLSTITVDNASANDTMITKLKVNLGLNRGLVLDGVYFHIRCASHILNRIVQDGLSTLGNTLLNIRESCKYVRSNPQRKLKWKAAVDQVIILTEREILLDCQTRWNSTYDMLEVALKYKEAFVRLAQREDDFRTNPSEEEWEFARSICDCLKIFNDSTQTLSGSHYPTTDIFFSEVCEIHICLKVWKEDENPKIREMAGKMMKKFEKYWIDYSLVLAVAFVLNPGFKLKFVENYFIEIYQSQFGVHTELVRKALTSFYNAYAPPTTNPPTTSQPSSSVTDSRNERGKNILSVKNKRIEGWYQREGIGSNESKTELDLYLEEPLFPLTDISLLDWWRVNSPKYPTLSKMARDILCIPVTSVPSESAFSGGGRVLNDFRASLDPKTVEALLCTQSWLPDLIEGVTNETIDVNEDEDNDIETVN